ncbi:MAG: flagellar biosynthetic protein FliO [Bacteriovoracaceae bacterium]
MLKLIPLFFTLSLSALAGVKVTSLDLTTNGANGFINVGIMGRSSELPDVKVNGKIIEINLAEADAFNAISKNIRGAFLSANTLNGKAIIKAVLPYEVPADQVNLGWNNKSIEIIFPRLHSKTVIPHNLIPTEVTKTEVAPKKEELKVETKVTKAELNESYLNNLMEESTAKAKTEVMAKDEVKLQQAAPKKEAVVKKETTDNFSFAGYAAKFGLFLALVLGLFYGVVQLLKKGVFNRGKLGFLNNTKMIEVLSTTYVAPKRSLMIVKAHKQIFLVANSESGLQFLSEMTDTSGLIKEGEKFVTGTNFDTNLTTADIASLEASIKIKENIMESTPVNEESVTSKIAVAKDIVKFSDELKKKAKKLKPIEFN